VGPRGLFFPKSIVDLNPRETWRYLEVDGIRRASSLEEPAMSTSQDNNTQVDETTRVVLFVLALALALVLSLTLPVCIISAALSSPG
jgi:hypothetical protein